MKEEICKEIEENKSYSAIKFNLRQYKTKLKYNQPLHYVKNTNDIKSKMFAPNTLLLKGCPYIELLSLICLHSSLSWHSFASDLLGNYNSFVEWNVVF